MFESLQIQFIDWYTRQSFNKAAQITFLETFEILSRKLTPAAVVNHMIKHAEGSSINVLIDMQTRLKLGKPMMEAAYRWFPDHISTALLAAEKSDPKSLNDVISETISLLKSPAGNILKNFYGTFYAILILFLSIILCVVVDTRILQPFEYLLTKGGKSLTDEMVFVKNVSYFVGNYLVPTFLVFCGIFFWVRYWLRNSRSEFRFSLDKYPFISLYREYTSLYFLQVYSSLKKMKLADFRALETIYTSSSNNYLKYHIESMLPPLKDHGKIEKALDTGLLRKADLATISAIASTSTSGFAEALSSTRELALKRFISKLAFANRFLWVFIILIALIFAFTGFGVIMSLGSSLT